MIPILTLMAFSLVLTLVLVYIVRKVVGPYFEGDPWSLTVIVLWLIFTNLTGFLIWTLSTEHLTGNQAVVDSKGGIVRHLPEPMILWRWDDRLKGGSLKSYTLERREVSMLVEPITDNPKVRRVFYYVDVEIKGTMASLLDYQKSVGDTDPNSWIQNHLYEFNERHSREIGQFYNPLDKNQQEQFSALAERFFKPRFAGSGVKFTKATFDLWQPQPEYGRH